MRLHYLILLGTVLANVTNTVAATEGELIYASKCVACHQQGAVGAPGIAPPLANTLEHFSQSELGQQHLVRVLITGLNGVIVVNGERYNSNMPSFAKLSDQELVQVMTHILVTYNNRSDLSWLNPQFVAGIRKEAGSASDTHKMRQRLQTNTGGK